MLAIVSSAATSEDVLRCMKCPPGALCDKPGITWDTLTTTEGWYARAHKTNGWGNSSDLSCAAVRWRSSNASLSFYRCLLPMHCGGGRESVCKDHRTGPVSPSLFQRLAQQPIIVPWFAVCSCARCAKPATVRRRAPLCASSAPSRARPLASRSSSSCSSSPRCSSCESRVRLLSWLRAGCIAGPMNSLMLFPIDSLFAPGT